MTKESKGSTYRLYIGKLSRGVDEEDLKKRLSRYGQVEDLVLTRRDTEAAGDFVHLTLRTDAIGLAKCQTAFSGARWWGRKIKIALAHPNYNERLDKEREQSLKVSFPPKKRALRTKCGFSSKLITTKRDFPVTAEDVDKFKNWKVSKTNIPVTPFRTRLPTNSSKVVTIDPTKYPRKHKIIKVSRDEYSDDPSPNASESCNNLERLRSCQRRPIRTFSKLRDSTITDSVKRYEFNNQNIRASDESAVLQSKIKRPHTSKSITLSNEKIEGATDTPITGKSPGTEGSETLISTPKQDSTQIHMVDWDKKSRKRSTLDKIQTLKPHKSAPKSESVLRQIEFNLSDNLIKMNAFIEDEDTTYANSKEPVPSGSTAFYVESEGGSDEGDLRSSVSNKIVAKDEIPDISEIVEGRTKSDTGENKETIESCPSKPSSIFDAGYSDLDLNIEKAHNQNSPPFKRSQDSLLTSELAPPDSSSLSRAYEQLKDTANINSHNEGKAGGTQCESSNNSSHLQNCPIPDVVPEKKCERKVINNQPHKVNPKISTPASSGVYKYSINVDPAELFCLNADQNAPRKAFTFNFYSSAQQGEAENAEFTMVDSNITNEVDSKNPDVHKTQVNPSVPNVFPESEESVATSKNKMFFFHINNDELRSRTRYSPISASNTADILRRYNMLEGLDKMRPRLALACKRRRIAAKKGKLKRI